MITTIKYDEDYKGDQLMAYHYCHRHDSSGWEFQQSDQCHISIRGEIEWSYNPSILRTDFGGFKIQFCNWHDLYDIRQVGSCEEYSFRKHRKYLPKVLQVLSDFKSHFEKKTIVVKNSMQPEKYFAEDALFLHTMYERYKTDQFSWSLGQTDFSNFEPTKSEHPAKTKQLNSTMKLLEMMGKSFGDAGFDHRFAKLHFKTENDWNRFDDAHCKQCQSLLGKKLSSEKVFSKKWEKQYFSFLHSFTYKHAKGFCYPP